MEKFDLIVVGGGISGVCAATAAAREHLKVLIIEKSGTFGGAITSSLVYPFMTYRLGTEDKENPAYLSNGLFLEMRRRVLAYEHKSDARESYFHPELYKIVLDDVLEEAGVRVLLHSTVYDIKRNGEKLLSVQVISQGKRYEFFANYFIDATGDGNLMEMSGCALQTGRATDGKCQPLTTCFRLGGVNLDLLAKESEALQKLYKKKRMEGSIKNPRENILTFLGPGDGILHLNTTRVTDADPTDPFSLSRAEAEGRKQVYEMLEFLRCNTESCKNAVLLSMSNEIGIRESRMLCGEYVLTEEDLLSCKVFDDAVAYGCYGVDIHSPDGTGTVIKNIPKGKYYQIPYRSLLPKEYNNLLAVGRCISATHGAQSAIRIIPICACVGEAGGLAVSVAAKAGETLKEVSASTLRRLMKEKKALPTFISLQE